MKKNLLFILISFILLSTTQCKKKQINIPEYEGPYDKNAVKVINNLIINNGLKERINSPETWDCAWWNDENPKQILDFFSWDNGLTGKVSFAGLTTLERLFIIETTITKLDVTGCFQLKELNCTNNKLTEIILTGCTQLKVLFCPGNKLTDLNLTGCVELINLICVNNCLTQLDVSDCINLLVLSCEENYLTEIDISKCTQLFTFNISYNYFTEIDISKCTQLYSFGFSNNNFTKFHAKNRQKLPLIIFCSKNRLVEFDVTGSDISEGSEFFDGRNQNVSFTLLENESGEYIFPVSLNNPTFGNSNISYSNNTLKSKNKKVEKTTFEIQVIGHDYFMLSGTMNFSYTPLKIKTPEKSKPNIYPNPVKETFFIECETFNRVIIYDSLGKAVLNQNANSKTVINISHLQNGIYIVDTFEGYKNIGTAKILKK